MTAVEVRANHPSTSSVSAHDWWLEGDDLARTVERRRAVGETLPWDAVGLLDDCDGGAPVVVVSVKSGTFSELDSSHPVTEDPLDARHAELEWLADHGFSDPDADWPADDVCGYPICSALSIAASPKGCTVAVAGVPYLVNPAPIPAVDGWAEAVSEDGIATLIVLVDLPLDNVDLTSALRAVDAGAAAVADVPAAWSTAASVHV